MGVVGAKEDETGEAAALVGVAEDSLRPDPHFGQKAADSGTVVEQNGQVLISEAAESYGSLTSEVNATAAPGPRFLTPFPPAVRVACELTQSNLQGVDT